MNLIEEFEQDGYDIKIYHIVDTDGDTSFIGEYTDKLDDYVIVRQFDEFYCRLTEEQKGGMYEHSREYRYFQPYAGGEKKGTKEYFEYGMQDYNKMESLNNGNWQFIGIVVKAFYMGVALGIASCWGIESDAKDIIKETTADLIKEALDDAEKTLDSMRKGGKL